MIVIRNIFDALTSNPSRVYFASGIEVPLQLYKINTASTAEISMITYLDGMDEDLRDTYICGIKLGVICGMGAGFTLV